MAPSLPFDKLNESNYDDWKLQMEAYLEEKELFGFLDGTQVAPTTGPNSKSMRTYQQKQRLARAKLILAVEPSQLPHVRDEDPAVIWMNLSKIHSARGLGTLLMMRRNFFTMTMPADTSIATWVAQVRHAAYKLDECYRLEQAEYATTDPLPSPRHVTDLDKVMVLMSGLPSTFNSLLVYIAAIPISRLDFEDIVTRLLNEEQRQKPVASSVKTVVTPVSPTLPSEIGTALPAISSERPGARAGLASRISRKPVIKCHKCGGVGHFRNQCPTRDSDALPQANVAIEANQDNSAFELDEIDGAW